MAGLRFPYHGRSRQICYRIRPSAEGRTEWLILVRKILSFSIPNRFIPAHCGLCTAGHSRLSLRESNASFAERKATIEHW